MGQTRLEEKGISTQHSNSCCFIPRAAAGLVRWPRARQWLLFLLLLRDSSGPDLTQRAPGVNTAPWVWPGRAGTRRLTLPDTVKIVGEEEPRRAGGCVDVLRRLNKLGHMCVGLSLPPEWHGTRGRAHSSGRCGAGAGRLPPSTLPQTPLSVGCDGLQVGRQPGEYPGCKGRAGRASFSHVPCCWPAHPALSVG